MELRTTHSQLRIFLIVARFCSIATWQDDYRTFFTRCRDQGLRFSLAGTFLRNWWMYHLVYDGLRLIEWQMDLRARFVKMGAWFRGLVQHGFRGAREAAAGLA
jgi:aarF domain-containing kinase